MDPVLADVAMTAAREAVRASLSGFVERHVRRKDEKRGDEKREKAIRTAITRALDSTDEGALALHVREANGWASLVHLQGMPRPVGTDTASIPLTFAAVPRRFRAGDAAGESIDERELISGPGNYLILGDPGSGKTTTIKRLVLSLFEESPVSDGNPDVAFPVLIVCRDIDWTTTDLPSEIAHRIGIDVDAVAKEVALNESNLIGLVADVLDALPATLVVDGIDEIPDADARSNLVRALSRLQRVMGTGRLICSCRSGDAPHLEGYSTAELLPLSRDQITEIVAAQTTSPDKFIELVEGSTITELLDRPLFLTQLLILFETSGALPERPVDLYRQLVRLLLHEWDEQRSIKRRSVYANFDASAKQDFLSEVAFRLTRQGKASFSEDDLLEIYGDLADAFGLPKRRARQIVREIESHVGLVADIPGGFQFTHFTLQEYLCADSIVRQGMNDDVAAYLGLHPEVMAVAVALSSRPSQWLAECVSRSRRFDTTRLAAAFARRLGSERPRFTASRELGQTVVELLAQSDVADIASWRKLSELDAVRESIGLVRDEFHFDTDGVTVKFFKKLASDDAKRSRVPRGQIPKEVFELYAAA
jgi:DNA polymerase III delta prime subunit